MRKRRVSQEARDRATELLQWVESMNQRMSTFRENGKMIIGVYRARDQQGSESRKSQPAINLHFANVETLKATVYARTPRPEVVRRRKNVDDSGAQLLAEAMLDALKFWADEYDMDDTMEAVLVDHWNTALGQIRVRYKPYFEPIMRPKVEFDIESGQTFPVIGKDGQPAQEQAHDRIPLSAVEDIRADGTVSWKYFYEDGDEADAEDVRIDQQGPYADGEAQEQVVYEEIVFEYVPWNCFVWDIDAKDWNRVERCAITYPMTQAEATKEFGKRIAEMAVYEQVEKTGDNNAIKRALFHEIFDKATRKCTVVTKGVDGPVRDLDDPYKLENFYPFPKPLFGTITCDPLLPVPIYRQAERLYEELDCIEERIIALVGMLKIRGVYDASRFKELGVILSKQDGYLHGVEGWPELAEKGGLQNAISFVPIDIIYGALTHLMAHRETTIQLIDQVVGMSDASRGSTRASEPGKTQEIKQTYQSARVQAGVRKVARFMRDVYRIAAELGFEHMSVDTISQISGKQIPPDLWEQARSDVQRKYAIDVQTDTMTVPDEEAEVERRTAVIGSVSQLLQSFTPMVQAGIVNPDAAKMFIKWLAGATSKGRELEDEINTFQFAMPKPTTPTQPGVSA